MSSRFQFIQNDKLSKSIPRNINIDSTKVRRGMIDELLENKLSPFCERPMRDLWLYCLGIGIRHNMSAPLKRKSASIPTSALGGDGLAAVFSVSVSIRKDLEFLSSDESKDIFKTAEEHANAGLDIAYRYVFGDESLNALDIMIEELRRCMKDL